MSISVAVSELKSANAAICPIAFSTFNFLVSLENDRETASLVKLVNSKMEYQIELQRNTMKLKEPIW